MVKWKLEVHNVVRECDKIRAHYDFHYLSLILPYFFSLFFRSTLSLSLSFVFSLAPFTSFLYVALPFLRHVFLTPEKWCKYVERWLLQAINKNGWLNDITIVRVHVHTRVMSEHPTKLTRKKMRCLFIMTEQDWKKNVCALLLLPCCRTSHASLFAQYLYFLRSHLQISVK